MGDTVQTKDKAGGKETYPVLPLRDIVVFPYMIVPLFVGRERSISALEEVMRSDKHILLAAQKNAGDDDPATDAIYEMGTLASVLQLLKLPDGTVKVLVEGTQRARIVRFTDNADYFEAEVARVVESVGAKDEIEALARSAVSQFESYVKLNKKISPEVLGTLGQIDDYSKLADTIASHLAIKIADKQEILEITSLSERLERVYTVMESEISVLQVEKKIRSRVKRQMEKTQREYYLNEQMKAIQKELGDSDERDDIAEFEEKIENTKLSKEARDKAIAELKKLRQMSPMSAEATVVRNYLDWLLSIPWGVRGKVKKDLAEAQEILDKEHYGLEKVKERIVEYLAVQNRTNKLKGPILCLVGPPGVGKTSLGKSIANATGREFVRMSLGGVRDEAEIRGHRRTYIGSMPGKVIQSMRKAKRTNPLFLLDEIDKMGSDFRGDPAAALLEVLDPEQNHTFNDHYLEVDYDLSNVMFVTTANTLNIPPALMDRMEIIRLAGYTEDEKVEIAKRHLIPNQQQAHGLAEGEWSLDDTALKEIIRRYTREAGVRSLEREIAKLDPQGGQGDHGFREEVRDDHARQPRGLPRRAEVPLRRGGGRGPNWGRDRPCLDRGWRRVADDRRRDDARQGQDVGHRQSPGRDEGEHPGGECVCTLPLGRLRHPCSYLRAQGYSRPRAGGCHTQGRPIRGRRHGDRDRLGPDRHPDPQGRGDDRRDHAARPDTADRRPQGEAAGRAPRRHQEGRDPRGEREGPCRDPRQRQKRAGGDPGEARRRRSEGRAPAHARADRVGKRGHGSGNLGRGRG